MIKRFLVIFILIFILSSSLAFAEEGGNIEIFDPKKDMVVKEMALEDEVKIMVKNWLKNLKEVHPLLSPIKDEGYTIRFTFKPEIPIENDFFDSLLSELYLIIPEKDSPFFLIFNEENKALCFKFSGDLDLLSKALSFKFTKN